MPKLLLSGLLALAAVFTLAAQQSNVPAPPAKKIFSININPPQDAAATELEFSDTDLSQIDPQNPREVKSRTIRTTEKAYRDYLPQEFRFFRVRSIHKTGVPGAWSKTQLVENFLQAPYREPKLPLLQQGATEYLLGSRIELPQQPGLVTRYQLDEGEIREYREPIIFDRPGTYRMTISMETGTNEVVLKRTYIFKVELTAPETHLVINQPIHSRRGIKLGKDSSLLFFAIDTESGIAKTYFRVAPLGKAIEDLPFREYTKRISWGEFCADSEINLVQYYSADLAGNKEKVRRTVLYCETALPE